MFKLAQNKHGFTLIELLVVISIIGILATLVSANLNSARSRARDAARKSDVRNIATGLRLYFNDKGYFPATCCSWGNPWVDGSTTYMSVIPKDPLPDQDYKYVIGASSDTFTISACLENKSDSNAVTTSDTAWCPSGKMFQLSQ